MKIKSVLLTGILLMISIACGTTKSNNEDTYSGIIEPAGITTYQYGTHILKTENTFYALKSENIDLDEHTGKKLSVHAEKIEGYPVDGGPVYLQVTKILE